MEEFGDAGRVNELKLREAFYYLYVFQADFDERCEYSAVIVRPAFHAGRRTYGFAGSAGAAGGLHRSFLGSPRRSRGLRFVRMTAC